MKDIKNIYKSEKSHCPANDIKLFKEYFKSKYQFYYKMKNEFEDEKTCYNFSYDIYYPPMIISLNSEIRPYLKELCEYFNINFDLSIDKGKSFSYNINVFYPTYFGIQSKNFQFNPYELTFNEIISGEMTNKNKNEINIEAKPTEILRNKYKLDVVFDTWSNGKTITKPLIRESVGLGNKTIIEKEIRVPILKATKIGTVVDPRDIFYSIEEYFSLEKSDSERIEPIGATNDDKIVMHGFDTKVSFRG